ncbi:MAG TPA: sigma-70 family RNA polymerase sigma factor [Phycisphaerales bacterium]|nr:sigma-70 family RNA polymerase sigma factor [Phycisphaerales bacterium]
MNPAMRVHMPTQSQPEPPAPAASPLGQAGGFDIAWATRGTTRGDARAFEVLYRAWFGRVYAYARGLTGRDESFCLDVTQEVMLRAARSIPELHTEAALAAWLSRACVSAAVDLVRREQRARRREQAVATSEQHADAGMRQDLQWLRDSLRQLPETEHLLLMQRVVNGLTLREAAASVGIGEHAAHGRVRRALQRLRGLAKEVWP